MLETTWQPNREADREKQRATFREIRRQVARVRGGDADCGLSDAGLRTWNDANANSVTDLSASLTAKCLSRRWRE